jgi:hypothetical protein
MSREEKDRVIKSKKKEERFKWLVDIHDENGKKPGKNRKNRFF